MRNFLFEVPQQLFADDLGHDLLFGHIGRNALREHERPRLCKALADLHQAVQPVVPLCADGNDVRKVQQILIGRNNRQQRFLFHGIDLVDDQNRRNLCFPDLLNQLLLLRADVCDRLNQQNDGVDVGHGLIDDVDHIIAQLCARSMEARRVDKHQLCIAAVDDGADAVARGLRLMRNNCDFLTHERVCKRGLANVRAACDGDHRGFCVHMLLLIWKLSRQFNFGQNGLFGGTHLLFHRPFVHMVVAQQMQNGVDG